MAGPVLCFGKRDLIQSVFGADLLSIKERNLPADLAAPNNLYVKGFVEEALCKALARGKPLLSRVSRYSASLIADTNADRQTDLKPLASLVGAMSGTVSGILTPETEDHPTPEKISWAESVRVSIDVKDGQLWLLLEPDIWIEPTYGRKAAVAFLDARRGDRFNKKFNDFLDAWIQIVLGTAERKTDVTVSLFDGGAGAENPSFQISSRTAFARRHPS